ncbi:MAG TPA: CGNR zinc finger domain-containing protein [Candidatus Limnocylindria bacterium]|jgi:predicted RNA-binding Zn ribbon-like protein
MTSEERIELIGEFVNTYDVEHGGDEVGTPEALRDWLVQRDLVDAATAPDAAAHARALAVREGIRALGRANNDEPLDATAVAAMNRAARATPLVVAVGAADGGAGWQLSPGAGGVDGFVGRLLAAVTATMADGSFSRLKACRNDTCRWLFHDHSRNRSGTWCSMAGCGSRMKARAYRARQRSAAGA